MNVAFAGDRDIAVRVLEFLVDKGARPKALLVPEPASHAESLVRLCPFLAEEAIVRGREFRAPERLAWLRSLELDYIIGVHYPYIIPPELLAIPRLGVLNLHPSLLPHNRGWHTPSWTILEGTPAGATLHFMDEGLDTGAIVHQREIAVRAHDTADSLYQRLKEVELQVFKEAWPALTTGNPPTIPQDPRAGTTHSKRDLFADGVRRVDLDAVTTAEALLRRLRALTTSSPEEAAFFEDEGVRCRVTVSLEPEPAGSGDSHD